MTSGSAAFTGRAFVAFLIGLAAATVIECVLRLPLFHPNTAAALGTQLQGSAPMSAAMVQWAVAKGLLVGTPLSLLPALWYARTRGPQAPPHAGLLTGALGVLLTALIIGWVVPAGTRAYTLETLQRARRIIEENGRARRPSGVAPVAPSPRRGRMPPLRPMMPDQALAADAASKTWPDLVASARVDPERASLYRLEARRRTELAALAGVLAFLGWTLGSLGLAHALHPVMWWLMAWLVTFRMGGVATGTSLVVFTVAAVSMRMLSPTTGSDAPRNASHALSQEP